MSVSDVLYDVLYAMLGTQQGIRDHPTPLEAKSHLEF